MNKLLELIAARWRQLSLSILAAITVLSLIPLSELPEFPGSDKTHHLLAYGLLMLPVALKRPRYWPLWLVFFAAWSGVIELVQPYVNRYGEWLDLLANIVGLLLGVVVAYGLHFYQSRLTE